MSPIQRKPGRARGAQPRKVRIVKPRATPRAATVSVLLAVTAAVLLPVLWWFGRSEQLLPPPPPSLDKWEMDWRCDAGHTFRTAGHAFDDDGATRPKTCWVCRRPAHPMEYFQCSVHGAQEVLVSFAENANGGGVPARWRLPGRGWVDEQKDLRCRQCNRPLRYLEDALRGVKRPKKRGGG